MRFRFGVAEDSAQNSTFKDVMLYPLLGCCIAETENKCNQQGFTYITLQKELVFKSHARIALSFPRAAYFAKLAIQNPKLYTKP